MTSPLFITQTIMIYGSAILLIVVATILIKYFYANSVKCKLQEYQREIAKSHSRILKLEVTNDQLKQKVSELETIIHRPKIA
ncbi:MAG: hypothetical protein IT251_03225 [Chitinophagaceae bacterium]|jgi:cell division protein FtsL|nr:hypothetical protein [Chitinophagaceae bacterium]